MQSKIIVTLELLDPVELTAEQITTDLLWAEEQIGQNHYYKIKQIKVEDNKPCKLN